MKKTVNLKTLTNACKDDLILKLLIKQYDLIKLKETEKEDLVKLVNFLHLESKKVSYLDGYYVNYIIKQINKEFDLLKYTEEGILNIELKSTFDEGKVLKQQKKNHLYLKAITDKIDIITYISENNKLYRYNNAEKKLQEISSKEFIEIMSKYRTLINLHLDEIFQPSKYLISPFNDTKKFIESKYILTQHQQEIVDNVVNLNNNHIIEGRAGTGKSLVLYDIGKRLVDDGLKVTFVHCGQLNNGHYKLRKAKEWDIIPVKNALEDINFTNENAILIDEVQRIYPEQLQEIVRNCKENDVRIIFSIDRRQYLDTRERDYNNLEVIQEIVANIKYHKLTEKIRSNKEIAYFIKELFDNKKINDIPYKNIEIDYLSKDCDFKEYIDYLESINWKYIPFTVPLFGTTTFLKYSCLNQTINSHKVIGQEFENVVVVLDENFELMNNSLNYIGEPCCYDPLQMLFQNVTRTRTKLKFIILENKKLYSSLLKIIAK
ncbi:ATP-binding protein [Staphylococcus gallinarum]|uniref:ATP-binding protein n=1 Tax=Staphylococcus gallinarum TaxID=1293 RepID=A0A3A0VRX9_STAGA|nr:DNA/RNA helicase domain-containing protein [Staphylococcus gallinarum]RIP34984.1 ATP-binding protein [Staphylococcus gallinarum]